MAATRAIPTVPVRVCVLEMDSLERYAEAAEDEKTYPRLYEKWFAKLPGFSYTLAAFDVAGTGALPSPAEEEHFDLFLLTGSKHGAYEDLPWISATKEYICGLRARRRRVLGICFGHQIMAHALGGLAEKNPRGLELGHVAFPLSALEPGRALSLLYIHGDHVARLPPGFHSLGGNAHTLYQGMLAADGLAASVQGHPEFDAHVLRVLLHSAEERAAGLSADLAAAAEARLDAPTDEAWLLARLLDFLGLPRTRGL